MLKARISATLVCKLFVKKIVTRQQYIYFDGPMTVSSTDCQDTRELKQTTTTTATRTSTNKSFNEQNNGCALALYIFVHFFAVLCKTTT